MANVPVVSFRLPRSMPWITSQNEPGTSTKSYITERFDAVKGVVDEAKADFDSAIDGINSMLQPVIVDDLKLKGVEVPSFSESIPEPANFVKSFSATMPQFTASLNAQAPTFTDTISGTIPAFTETLSGGVPDFAKSFWENF